LALSHYGGIEKEQEALNFHGFPKIEHCHKKGSLSFTFYMVLRHEVYSFLDDFSGYHQIIIALKDMYKTTFIINWGTFV
jgi:hypothetical protein